MLAETLIALKREVPEMPSNSLKAYPTLGNSPGTRYIKYQHTQPIELTIMGVIGFDGDQEVNEACRALGVS